MTICIIHTGGTIAMRAGPDGLAPADGVREAGLEALARAGIARGETEVVHLTPAIDSANARFADWNRIAEVIHAGESHYSGFVVTHGTDTLAYTAALSFALVGLARPVIVTGSMLPLEAAGTDARQNLGDALLAATRARWRLGAVCRKVDGRRTGAQSAFPSGGCLYGAGWRAKPAQGRSCPAALLRA